MKKQKKIINVEIEYTVPFTADQVRLFLAKRAGCKEPAGAYFTLTGDGGAIVRYTVKK